METEEGGKRHFQSRRVVIKSFSVKSYSGELNWGSFDLKYIKHCIKTETELWARETV